MWIVFVNSLCDKQISIIEKYKSWRPEKVLEGYLSVVWGIFFNLTFSVESISMNLSDFDFSKTFPPLQFQNKNCHQPPPLLPRCKSIMPPPLPTRLPLRWCQILVIGSPQMKNILINVAKTRSIPLPPPSPPSLQQQFYVFSIFRFSICILMLY